jgi:hypothetical protein
MAQLISHSHVVSSSSSTRSLPTLSAKARERAATFRKLADDLDRHDSDDMHGDARIVAFMELLLNGGE